MTFQIIEDFGNGVKGYSNFESNSNDSAQIKRQAVSIVKKTYKDDNFNSPLPTIKIIEYDTINNCKKKKGLFFTATWK